MVPVIVENRSSIMIPIFTPLFYHLPTPLLDTALILHIMSNAEGWTPRDGLFSNVHRHWSVTEHPLL